LLQVSKQVSQKRTNDTTAIKAEILGYLNPSDNMLLGIPIPSSLPTNHRGMEHQATARFLIPRRHLEEFEAEPQA
jgi:hypothetical protein